MSLGFEQKEALYMRMADLRQKLKESEEERSKLERAFDILTRVFLQEQKMHYKILNNKYEKFLEDCKLRKRRNDVILKSLWQVEDRARALFNKTERLKLLKDHYVSYIKQNDLQRTESSSLPWESLPSQTEKTTHFDESTSKSVHWKTPFVADLIPDDETKDTSSAVCDNIQEEETKVLRQENYNGKFINNFQSGMAIKTIQETFPKQFNQSPVRDGNMVEKDGWKLWAKKNEECQKESEGHLAYGNAQPKEQRTTNLIPENNPKEMSRMNSNFFNNSEINFESRESNNFEKNFHPEDERVEFLLRSKKDAEFYEKPETVILEGGDLKTVGALREEGVVRHQESIDKLKIALSIDCAEREIQSGRYFGRNFNTRSNFSGDEKVIEKDEVEISEKEEEYKKQAVLLRSPRIAKNELHSQNSPISFNSSIYPKSLNSPKQTQQYFAEEQLNRSDERDRKENSDAEENVSSNQEKQESYPIGLDGIDYQNETYPESFYEQPVRHHDYSNIASNVILEEDEYELDADQPEGSDGGISNLSVDKSINLTERQVEEKQFDVDSNYQLDSFSGQKGQFSVSAGNEAYQSDELSGGSARNKQFFNFNQGQSGNSESQNSSSEKSLKDKEQLKEFEIRQSIMAADKLNDERLSRKAENNGKSPTKVNQSHLVHLLESDSESFQIENGGLVSNKEDSDFDFSFG